MQVVYVEHDILAHPRVKKILSKIKKKQVIEIDKYSEVFNPKGQNFRQQKKNPALILAKKNGKKVLPTPEGFGIGGKKNFYFSHMLNCIYDCRYCFLQGMYPSANYVLFVNYEDFMADIAQTVAALNEPAYFFSGYDCDSLAYEPMTGFIDAFLPFFKANPKAILECRTKSTNIKAFLKHEPIKNCVIAFSFTPEVISNAHEHKVPSIEKRIKAMSQLADYGYEIGLRFDPLIYHENFKDHYKQLIDKLFASIDTKMIHSVNVGPMRFPVKMYQKIKKLYPQDELLAHPLVRRGGNMSYSNEKEFAMKQFVLEYLENKLEKSIIFECNNL